MINQKIAFSALSIVTALVLTGGATYAYFTDTASSSNNTFASGTMNLQIANPGDSSFSENVSATFNIQSLNPSDSVARTISFNNAGSTPIAEIAMGVTTTAPVDAGAVSDIRNVLNLSIFSGGTTNGNTCTGGTDITGSVASGIGDSQFPLTLNELNGATYDSLPISLPNLGSTGQVCVQVTMNSNAGNEYQGDSVGANFAFIAHQNVNQ